jgi:hypothetical protein
MPLPQKEEHSGKHPLITRWTGAQYLEIQRRAKRRSMSMMQYIERKVFDLPTEVEKHPAPREKGI